MKRSSWLSGSAYVPSNSNGLWVASTRNGGGRGAVAPSARRVADRHAEHEAVELAFGERVRPLELERVLGREHQERRRERVGDAVDGDFGRIHCLEERALRPG